MSAGSTPTEAALAPFRTCAAAAIATQQGAWAMGQAVSEATWSLVSLYAQQAQLTLGWAEVVGKTLATLADSKVLDDLVQANTALVRAHGRQALDSTSAAIGRLDADRPWMTPFLSSAPREPAASTWNAKPLNRRIT